LEGFLEAAKAYKSGKPLPEDYSSMTFSNLGNVTEDTLSTDLNNLLKSSSEGEFTKIIAIGESYHVFFIQKKDLVESELFNLAKDKLRFEIFSQKASKVLSLWLERESAKHFVKYFFNRP
jgi:peptidyl-prolyl cis-trans isomerase SurA